MPHQQFVCTRLFHPYLMRSSRTFSVTFTTSSLSTPAAYGSLKPAPTSRLRRTSLHLRYSIVPKHVLDTTPHRSVRAGLLHTAPTSDIWRRSARSDTDAGSSHSESIDSPTARTVPTSSGLAGSAAEARGTSARGPEPESCSDYPYCREQHSN